MGFAIGGDSAIKYLVLQVHYANVNSLQGMSAPFDNNNNYNAVSDYITKQLLFFWYSHSQQRTCLSQHIYTEHNTMDLRSLVIPNHEKCVTLNFN